MCLAALLAAGACAASKSRNDQNNYPYRPVAPQRMQYQTEQPPPYNNGQTPPRQGYDPWRGPPGYVSAEADRWRGPLGRRKYENDVYRYGIVEADFRAKRRRRRGAAAAAAGAGTGC